MSGIRAIGAYSSATASRGSSAQPTRAALYVRVSTAAQADKFSLPAQRRILQELAIKRGWEATLYDEGGVSAETISARPVMGQLLDDIESGLVDAVAVVEMERLCRGSDLRDWARISSTCRRAGVLVHTPERVFNLQAAEDDFEADLRGILSKREKRKLLERTQRGLDEAMNAGKYAGGPPPTGYKFDHAERKIVPDPEKVLLVQRVYESDLSAWQLSKQLRSEGINLGYQTIRRMRSLPFYLGLRKNTEGKLIKADWPAIITQELWDKQARRPKPAARRSSRRRGSAYLLSGIVRCGVCDGPIVGSPVRKSPKDGRQLYAYKCRAGHGQVAGWLLDAVVIDALVEYAGDPEKLKRRYAEALDAVQGGLVAERRAQLERKIGDLEDRQAKLLDAVERGAISDRVARRRSEEHEAALREARGQLEVLGAAEYVPSLPDLQAVLGLAEHIADTAQKDQRKLLDRLVALMTVHPRSRTVEITWRLGEATRSCWQPGRRRASDIRGHAPERSPRPAGEIRD